MEKGILDKGRSMYGGVEEYLYLGASDMRERKGMRLERWVGADLEGLHRPS